MAKTNTQFNWLYPLGFMGFGFVDTLFSQWILFFHAPPSESQNGFIGTVLMLSFILQGLFNPLLGYWGDKLRHAWGRRRPFILWGCPPLALVFLAIWYVRAPFTSAILLLGYGLLFVTVTQPYMALLPTIASTQAERVRYSLMGGILNLVASGLALIGGPLLINKFGYVIFGWIGAVIVSLTIFIPTLFLSEVQRLETAVPESLSTQFKKYMANRAFCLFILGNGLMILCILALTILLPYLTIAILNKPESYVTNLNLFVLSGVILGIVFTAKFGDKVNYLTFLGKILIFNALIISGLSVAYIYNSTSLPYWWAAFVCLGFCVFLAMMAPNVILAQFADQDGGGQEGAVFGLNGLAINLAKAMAAQACAFFLLWGKTPENPVGVQLILGFCALVALIAAWFLFRANLAQQMAKENPTSG